MASTHAYLLFFTNQGKVYWQKVYDLPQLGRDSRGRAIVNLLNLAEGEKIADCRAVRDFDQPGHFLMMATAQGTGEEDAAGKPTAGRRRGGIIAIKLREDDELVDVVVTSPGDEVVLSTAHGMAIRFQESDARPMGRNTSGVKGINLAPATTTGRHGRRRTRRHAADRLRRTATASGPPSARNRPLRPTNRRRSDDAALVGPLSHAAPRRQRDSATSRPPIATAR